MTSEPVTTGDIESSKDFEKTASGQYKRWLTEMNGANTRLRRWHKAGDRVVNRYLDRTGADRVGTFDNDRQSDLTKSPFSLNLFHSNTNTLNSLLYGNLPEVDVSRKFADANDDVARVAAEMMERLLNTDITQNSDAYDAVLRSVLQDRLLPGLGVARLRYEFKSQKIENPNDPDKPIEKVTDESAPIDYFHWRDVLWGWGRNFKELPWIAYRTYLTKDEVEKRFGEEVAKGLTFKKQLVVTKDSSLENPDLQDVWNKAEIWEIWDKLNKKVCWLSKGYDKIIETKDDPLGLKNFYPSPPFFIANATTSLYTPTPDFHLSQDLYNEIDILQSRIAIITEAVKVVGVYDKSAEGVERMFNEGVDNKLIPVDNWAMFAEKGGIRGQIDWFPIADVVNALDKLRQVRDETIALLQQVTGMSDLMQGGLQNQYEGVGQSQIKAKFGSVRIQKLQDDFAAFASSLMQIKAEIISKHFDPQTIVKQSNMLMSFDKELIPAAVTLIKNPEMAALKVIIRPESVAMTDFVQLQNERTGYLNAISTFMQSAAPLIESDPAAKPFLLQLLQWGLAGFKGSSEIEGVIDKAVEATQKQAQQPDKPSPEEIRIKGQTDLENTKHQNAMQQIAAKAQASTQERYADLQADIQTEMARHKAKVGEIRAGMEANLTELQAKFEADSQLEVIQGIVNMEQTSSQQDGEVRKDAATISMEIEKEREKTRLKIIEDSEKSGNKINEMAVQVEATKIKTAEINVEKEDAKGKGEGES